MISSTFVGTPLRFYLFIAGFLLYLFTPLFAAEHKEKVLRVSTSKHPERFGLFTIIVLGETIVTVISGLAENHHPTFTDGVGAFLGILIGFSLWWVYFDFVARRPFKSQIWYLYSWVYLHIILYLSVVTMGAAILNATKDHSVIMPLHLRFNAYLALANVGWKGIIRGSGL